MSKKSISSVYGTKAGVTALGPFKGVCPYMANDISDGRSTSEYLEYTENMWRDPRFDGRSIMTFPGFRSVLSKKLSARIHSACTFYNQYSGKRDLAVHSGERLLIFGGAVLESEPYIISGIADRKCSLISERGGLLVFDGERPKYIYASGEGEYSAVSDEAVYIPTVYRQGQAAEKRNLLSHRVYEEREMPEPSELLATRSLTYSYNSSLMTCTVTGVGTKDSFICIPSKTTYGGKEYKVTGIADGAFYANIGIETLIIGADVSVGKSAFEYCTGLKFVAFEKPTGDVEVSIGERAFFKAPISTLYIDGANSEEENSLTVSDKAFGNDTASGLEVFGTGVHFGGTANEFSLLVGYEHICAEAYTGLTFEEPYAGSFSFYLVPVLSGVRRVESASLDGEELDFGAVYRSTTDPATVRYAVIYAPSERTLEGETVRLKCLVTSRTLRTSFGEDETVEAVRACHIAVPYDGRIFLTGNPELPNTVFYTGVPSDGDGTSSHPFYFPEGNVFDDGVSDQPNVDMLASPSALIVIKSDRGGVYYHRAADKSGTRVYPCEEGAVSVGGVAQGCATFFNGNPCFVGENDIYLIKGGVSSEKKVYAIDSTLPELKVAVARGIETERISLGSLCGYLALCADGEIYLADTKELIDGIFPCWFKLSDIGIYDGDVEEYTPVTERLRLGGELIELDSELYASLDGDYVSLSCPNAEDLLECLDGEDCTGEVFESELYTRSESGEYSALGLGEVCVGVYRELSRRSAEEVIYCVSEKSGGRCGGEFDPCALLLDIGGTAAFATEGGGICVFNTDMTGPEAYSFNGRAIRSVLVTGRHACGEPACAKTTVRGSVILSCPVTENGAFTASCCTDADGMRVISRVSASKADASRLDFENMSFCPDGDGMFCVLDEKQRGFIYKQYRFADRAVHRPFGVRGLTYRYTRSAYKGRV